MPFFKLQEGERIIEEIKPLPSLRNYFLFEGIVSFIIFGLAILFFLLVLPFPDWLLFLLLFLDFLILPLFWVFSKMRYEKQYYWITNKRIVYKTGWIGYRISSIPLERISDIILSRSFIERLFGFGSLHVQTLAGQISYGYHGAEASLLAVPDPEGTQERIFQLLKKKRMEEKITF